jgi:cytochrome b pre-mRNA-processing protein 3
MLGFLFRRLTAETPRGAELFDAVTKVAREPHWYIQAMVPDSLDGRFAALATITALVLVRVESDGKAGDGMSVALTERFIEVMESEHRELGLGDPTLGRKVRKLVGSLSRRTDLLRLAATGKVEWHQAALKSLYKTGVPPAAVTHAERALQSLWARLLETPFDDIAQGKLQ